MVFPEVNKATSNGVPPTGGGAQDPVVPSASSFANETIDFVLFPEGYVNTTDQVRIGLLSKLSSELDAPLLVGAVDNHPDSLGIMREWQILLRFEPDSSWQTVYTKHSTAHGIAFEMPQWDPAVRLPSFDIGGIKVGATICHDHYLGLLPRFLARQGVQVWVNPSFDNVVDIKWSSILRLRAVENRFFSLCTFHINRGKRRGTHPFAFSPGGKELSGRIAGNQTAMPLSKCVDPGVYIVDLDTGQAGQPVDWLGIPAAQQPTRKRSSFPQRSARMAVIDHKPSVLGISGWHSIDQETVVETDAGPLLVGIVQGNQLLDASRFFRIIDLAQEEDCYPLIWNTWEELPADSSRLAPLLMGRAVECCAPILLSDLNRIYEHIELANRNKIPVRRTIELSGEQTVDLDHAWGRASAFKMVTGHLANRMQRERALDRYKSLG